MSELNPKFLVDENNRKVAALIDIETYNRLEEALEDYALAEMMKETAKDESLSLEESRSYYDQLLTNAN